MDFVVVNSNEEAQKDLFDDECKELASKRRTAKKTLYSLPNRTNVVKIIGLLLVSAIRFFRRKRREYLNGMVEEKQTASERKDPRTMYKTIKQFRGGQTQRANLIKDGNGNLLVEPDQIAASWREYFAALLNDVEEQHLPPTSPLQTEEDDLPTLEELREADKYLNYSKASVEDGIPAELLQTGSEVLEDLLYKLIVLIWQQEKMWHERSTGIIKKSISQERRHYGLYNNCKESSLLNTA